MEEQKGPIMEKAGSARRWRLITVLWLELALFTATFGLLFFFNIFSHDTMGYWCMGITALFVSLAANAYLAD